MSTRLALWLMPATALILIGVTTLHFIRAREIVLEEARNQVVIFANLADAELRGLVAPVQASVDALATQIPEAALSEERIGPAVADFLRTTKGAFGTTIALEPGAISPGSPRLAPYYYRDSDQLRFVDLAQHDFIDEDWYRLAQEADQGVWIPPYFDEHGARVFMITYSAPFERLIDGRARFAGVITADVALEDLGDALRRTASRIDLKGVELMIVDANGRLVSHPNEEWIWHESLQSLAERFDEPALATLADARIDMPTIHYLSPYLQTDAIAFAHPIEGSNWTLILGINKKQAYADAIRAKNQIIAIAVTGLIALLGVIFLLTSRVTKPVALLAQTTRTIAEVNLDFELPEPTGHDEIAGLQRDFVHMRDSLRDNIARLQRETEARQKLESELEIARSIQMGLLPTRASVGGTLREVEIAAKLIPAKAVGGDLYNYFYVDDDTLCFAVGDVSDKGVPAALFMARTNTLVRPATRYFRELDTVLGWLANELTMGNSDCMFVTMLCCAMNLRTGAVSLANASHLAPLLVRHDGSVELKDIQFGPPLGVSSSASYPIGEVTLEVGDAIILYSDGVTEAMNEVNEEFGEERLLALAKGFATMPTPDIAGAIVDAVNAHASTAPQSDDITVLVLRRTTEKTGDA